MRQEISLLIAMFCAFIAPIVFMLALNYALGQAHNRGENAGRALAHVSAKHYRLLHKGRGL